MALSAAFAARSALTSLRTSRGASATTTVDGEPARRPAHQGARSPAGPARPPAAQPLQPPEGSMTEHLRGRLAGDPPSRPLSMPDRGCSSGCRGVRHG
eukprot:scaffold71210_cov78-Phaeocystis_antarctica.AAC.3